jgi:uncharacterized membrane protein YbhN (UPF0104 family)
MKVNRARVVSWLISGSCVAGFLLWARRQPMPRLPANLAESLALLTGVVAYAAATVGLCERWSLLLRGQAPSVSRLVGYRPVVVGQLGNIFLPARVGDAIRVGLAAASQDDVSTQRAVGALIAERALDIGCHAVLLVVVLAAALGPSGGVSMTLLIGLAIVLGLALFAGAIAALRVVGRSVLSRVAIERRMPKLLGSLLAPLVGLRHDGRKAALLSVAMWASEIGGWWAASHAVGLNLTGPQAAYVFAIASLALIMPVGFGAIGTLDAGILFGVKTVGASTAAVLSFVVLLRVLFVLPSLVMVVWISQERHLVRLRRAILLAVRRRPPSADI